MKTWANHLFHFYKNLKPLSQLPNGIQWLYPQQSPEVLAVLQTFLQKYYNDVAERTLMLGINPGRFGAGITGVNFTASKQLTEVCCIEHPFKKGSELSAEFMYAMMEAYGGVEAFYRHFFIGSVCPLGFVKEGKNINYYDDKDLLKSVEPFIINSIYQLFDFNVNRAICFCIGEDKNFKYLTKLNKEHGWFKQIVALPHPRFVMQYKRKQLPQYIQKYISLLKQQNQ